MAKDTPKHIQSMINDIFLFGDGSFDQFEDHELMELLQTADDYYSNKDPIISDEQYDALRRYCETAYPDHTYFLGVGSQVRGGKVKLPYTMGSLTQAYEGDAQKWVGQYKLTDQDIVITEKLDGISTLIVYDQSGNLQIAYSRGDGIEGADITRHVSKIKKLPKKINGPAVIRAEIIFSKANWEIVKTKIKRSGGAFYKNARNATAGLMNASASDPIAYEYLDVVAYDVVSHQDRDKTTLLALLENNMFTVPIYTVIKGKRATDEYLTKILNAFKAQTEYEIDGLVLDVDPASLRQKINPSKNTLNPEFARKFKIADASNMAIATVKEVQWNLSKNGYLKPRVKVHPVELVGVSIQHATGFNAAFILNNGIGPGAQIRLVRSGDVIPFIVGVVKAVEPQMPNEQDTTWTKNSNGEKVDLVLNNAQDNDTVKLEQLIDFAAKMGIEHIGEGNMKSIYDAGYTTPTDFVKMQVNDIALAIGSKAIATKIQTSKLEKTQNVAWWIIAGAHPAFGRGIGQRKMKKLYDAFKGNMQLLANESAITGVEGFEEKTAKKIVAGFPAFVEFIEDCGCALSLGKYEAPKTGGLSGQTFLFTGFRDKGLEKQIEEKGGKISSSVSSKLNYLVALDPSETSGKLTKARELGTKIISRDQLVEML
jgi:NAD-dependent DNA ligase